MPTPQLANAPNPWSKLSVETEIPDSQDGDLDPIDLCDRGSRILRQPCQPAEAPSAAEHRYRDLLGAEAWSRLPPAIRRRFSSKPLAGATTVYRGEVLVTELSLPGRLLAQLLRPLGAPLPLDHGSAGPAAVVVTDEPGRGGQVWTRVYARRRGLPQVIQSTKRFDGPSGLEEDLGAGVTMRLSMSAEGSALVFRSTGYDIRILGRRLPLPKLLWPGRCEIVHRDEGSGAFTFSLTLTHTIAGRLIHQLARFRDD